MAQRPELTRAFGLTWLFNTFGIQMNVEWMKYKKDNKKMYLRAKQMGECMKECMNEWRNDWVKKYWINIVFEFRKDWMNEWINEWLNQ